MTIVVSKIAPVFELSLGAEEGGLFAALMWPPELGEIPFLTDVVAVVVPQGFVLVGCEGEGSIAFMGLTDEALDDFRASEVTIMKPIDDDYETKSVTHCKNADEYTFDFTSAIAA